MNVDVTKAREALTDHRFYKYRGCASDVDDPRRAAGNPALPVSAWGPYTEDGGEQQKARNAREKAAKAVCASCPVLSECRTWANQVDDDGRLAEREDVVAGGMTGLERTRSLVAARAAERSWVLLVAAVAAGGSADRFVLLSHAVATAGLQTRAARGRTTSGSARVPVTVFPVDSWSEQKQAVLEALAGATDEHQVAALAGMDVRTANWHRSKMCTLLGLPQDMTTRGELLAVARERGLLGAHVRVAPDGGRPVPAAPTTDGMRQRGLVRAAAVQLVLPDGGACDGASAEMNEFDDLMESAR